MPEGPTEIEPAKLREAARQVAAYLAKQPRQRATVGEVAKGTGLAAFYVLQCLGCQQRTITNLGPPPDTPSAQKRYQSHQVLELRDLAAEHRGRIASERRAAALARASMHMGIAI